MHGIPTVLAGWASYSLSFEKNGKMRQVSYIIIPRTDRDGTAGQESSAMEQYFEGSAIENHS